MNPETQDENPTDPLTHDELFPENETIQYMDILSLLQGARLRDEKIYTDRMRDTTPYSEHWSHLTQKEKGKLKPYIKGKVVIDLFGGLWENGESYIRALSKEMEARKYILQDAYLKGNRRGAFLLEGYPCNTTLGYPEFDGLMKIDFTDGDGLFMARSIPDNKLDLVFFLNGVNEYNIDSREYHASLAWEIVRALPPGGVVACSGSDAAEHFEQLGLKKVPDFEEPTALWIKPENHTLPSHEEWKERLYRGRN